jgi:pyridoxal phosphate enzyme (YggS family)
MNESLVSKIPTKYWQVVNNIGIAARSVGRDPESVQLLVVTKGQPIESIRAVISAGATCLGENYLEDALPKMDVLSNLDVEWHMIGHIQSRKTRKVAENFSWVHSLDRLKIARRLDHRSHELNQTLPVLLECNISGEASKYGWPVWDDKDWPRFVADIAPLFEMANLDVRGLMTMPPFDSNPEKSRPYFVKLRKLRDFLAGRFPQTDWPELSMGMSGDYQVAVQEGATVVRVGTAIMGSR